MNPSIFRTYEIRGVYGKDFDAEFVRRLSAHVAAYLKSGIFIVGCTTHAQQDGLTYALIDGAMHSGAQVIDIGMASSPQLAWAIRSFGAVGGILANRLPESGFRAICNRGGVSEIIGGHLLWQLYDGYIVKPNIRGSVTRRDVIDGYTAAIAYAANWHGGAELRMSIDAPESVCRVLRRLGPIAPDDAFAVRCDPSGEHMTFFKNGKEISADIVDVNVAELPELTLLRVHQIVHRLI